MKGHFKKVYIVILNWNGWEDTVECLESLLNIDYPNYQIIVCDNGSVDNSIHYIENWAKGIIQSGFDYAHKFGMLNKEVKKPIEYTLLSRNSAENGGDTESENSPLIIIDNGDNLGFAAGNNVALKYVMRRSNYDYVWILNNDTVVENKSLSSLVKKMNGDSKYGMCGSTIKFYHNPESVQAFGGASYNRWLGTVKELRQNTKGLSESLDLNSVEQRLSYISGASMLVTREFLNRIGLMNEFYFLYYEEIDWATRSKGIFKLGFEPNSIVYHKEGSSIGTNSTEPEKKSYLADYYGLKNRLVFTKSHYELCLPTVLLGLLIVLLKRLVNRQWSRAAIVIRVLRESVG